MCSDMRQTESCCCRCCCCCSPGASCTTFCALPPGKHRRMHRSSNCTSWNRSQCTLESCSCSCCCATNASGVIKFAISGKTAPFSTLYHLLFTGVNNQSKTWVTRSGPLGVATANKASAKVPLSAPVKLPAERRLSTCSANGSRCGLSAC